MQMLYIALHNSAIMQAQRFQICQMRMKKFSIETWSTSNIYNLYEADRE